MDCLIHLAASLCLLSPTELALRIDASAQISGDFIYSTTDRSYRGNGHVGRIQIDMPLMSYHNFTLFGGIEHMSLLDTAHDRGQERAYIGFSWRPFSFHAM